MIRLQLTGEYLDGILRTIAIEHKLNGRLYLVTMVIWDDEYLP